MFSDWAKFAGFAAILAIAIAVGILALQEPPKTTQKYQGTQQGEDQSSNTTNGAPPFVIFRTLTSGGLEEITKYCNSHSESEKKKWPQAYYCDLKVTDVWLAIFTGLLVIVTGGLINTAYRQETMARIHERAYIFGGGPCQTNVANIGTMTIQNYGRTPAFVEKVEWGLCDEDKFLKDISVSAMIDRGLLPSGTVETVKVEGIWPPNAVPQPFSSKIKIIYPQSVGKIFFGRFDYRDVFGDRHHSTFKLKLEADGPTPLDGCHSDWS
jgi:hypothetical protein